MSNNTADMMTLEQAKQFTRELNELMDKHNVILEGDTGGETYITPLYGDCIQYTMGSIEEPSHKFNIDSIW